MRQPSGNDSDVKGSPPASTRISRSTRSRPSSATRQATSPPSELPPAETRHLEPVHQVEHEARVLVAFGRAACSGRRRAGEAEAGQVESDHGGGPSEPSPSLPGVQAGRGAVHEHQRQRIARTFVAQVHHPAPTVDGPKAAAPSARRALHRAVGGATNAPASTPTRGSATPLIALRLPGSGFSATGRSNTKQRPRHQAPVSRGCRRRAGGHRSTPRISSAAFRSGCRRCEHPAGVARRRSCNGGRTRAAT